MPLQVIGERYFIGRDQEWFAAVAGDRNPMHMDAVLARRTLAGVPIAHGIHVLMWSLDSLFRHLPNLASVASISVNFEKMIPVGNRVQAVLRRGDADQLHVDVVVGGITAIRFDVGFAHQQSNENTITSTPIYRPTDPFTLTFEQMDGFHGCVPLCPALDEVGRIFPAAAVTLGAQRLAALACSSFLVGMVCPGLHSLYLGLKLVTAPVKEGGHDGLNFRVTKRYPGSRRVRLAVSGVGWVGSVGSVDALVRPEPASQADLSSLATKLAPNEFSGASALVVGGSRGLGEVVAKILAAGGAHLTLTYSIGEVDARRVQAEIAAGGGSCDIMRYDVRSGAQEQLSHLRTVPIRFIIWRRLRSSSRAGTVLCSGVFRNS